MRCFFHLLLCLTLVAGCATNHSVVKILPAPAHDAWWLRATYKPDGKIVHGIPIREIDSSWCFANEFSLRTFPQTALADVFAPLPVLMRQTGATFSISGRFDGTHAMTALAGVYETCDKKQGTFLLTVAESGNSASRTSLQTFRGAHFAILKHVATDTIDVWWCFMCDNTMQFKWDIRSRRFLSNEPLE